MTRTWDADSLVTPRNENVDRYKRNFLRQAVCEFRFPTLMELGSGRPPAAFVSAIRKEYPHMEQANELMLSMGTNSPSQSVSSHIFRSAKLNWTVSLKESSFSVETTSYTTFAQMKERVSRVIDAAAKIIDSDFFTRIGLRYINVIDSVHDPVDGWVNPQLVAPLQSGALRGVQEYAGKIHVAAEDGGCLLQHGIHLKVQAGNKGLIPEYTLDIDAFRNVVALNEALDALDGAHAQAFSMFDWAIGEAAREYLSKVR